MNLNDVFPNGLLGEGIFYFLNNYNVPWKESVTSLALDLEYYGNVSGGKTISPLLRRLLVNGVITESVAQKLANSLYSMNGLRWGKLWDTYNLEYNPIQNYNMTEVMSDDDTVTTYGRTHTKTGTESDDRTRTDDNKESVYGFNSNASSDSEESDRTINDDNTHTYNVSDTDAGSDTQTHSYELTRSGNIGVTTSQQMIESERSLWMWRYFYDVVFPDIDKMLTISVYSDDVLPVTMSGGITPTGEISITLNGDYDVTEYASAAVNVPNTYTAADEGMVVSDGELVSQIGREITENGTYDTTMNNATIVNVPNTYVAADEGKVVDNGALVAQGSQTITENGTYDTTLISELTANISGGGTHTENESLTFLGTTMPFNVGNNFLYATGVFSNDNTYGLLVAVCGDKGLAARTHNGVPDVLSASCTYQNGVFTFDGSFVATACGGSTVNFVCTYMNV